MHLQRQGYKNEKTRNRLGENHVSVKAPVPGIHKYISKPNNKKMKNTI